MALYEIKQLSYIYNNEKQAALKQISLDINKHQVILLCGKNGSGKTTLLKQLKSHLCSGGSKKGSIYFDGTNLDEIDFKVQVQQIAYLNQKVEEQIVHDQVGSELAFTLESLGYSPQIIHKKVMEMASYFGLSEYFHQDSATLSGGLKQCLNLASIMVLQPKVLLLDEPFSQLDPIACDKFLSILNKIKNEFQTTMIIVEQRLDLMLAFCDEMIYLDDGQLLKHGKKEIVLDWMIKSKHDELLPDYLKLYQVLSINNQGYQLKDVKEAFKQYYLKHPLLDIERSRGTSNEVIINIKNLSFAYDTKPIINNLNLKVCQQDILGILGANGSGKSTLLKLLLKQYRYIGKIEYHHLKMMYVPQNIHYLFENDCLKDDFYPYYDYESTNNLLKQFKVEHLINKNPYDLSLGELHKMAMIKMILEDSDCYLLDEISKGLDEISKKLLVQVLKQLQSKGKTIILVSHDVEFMAKVCNKVGLLFDGNMECVEECYAFFKQNYFYTTMISKVVKDEMKHVLILDDLINQEELIELPKINSKKKSKQKKTWFIPIVLLVLLLLLVNTNILYNQYCLWLFVGLFMLYFIYCVIHYSWKIEDLFFIVYDIIVIGITLVIAKDDYASHSLMISLIVLVEIMIPFVIYYLIHRLKSKELVMLACLCALAIASRGLLAFFPQVKIIAGLCIISALVFGKQFGFIMGALSMFVSNMLFAQGAWTPFQMVAMGLVAYLAPIMIIKQSKLSRSIYGFLAVLVLYGCSMNFATLLYTKASMNLETFLVYELSGLPMDLIHAISNAYFLYYFGDIFITKLKRYQDLNLINQLD